MFLKYLTAACALLVLVGTESINAAPHGFLEGHLKIVSLREVERSDEMPRSEVTAESCLIADSLVVPANFAIVPCSTASNGGGVK